MVVKPLRKANRSYVSGKSLVNPKFSIFGLNSLSRSILLVLISFIVKKEEEDAEKVEIGERERAIGDI